MFLILFWSQDTQKVLKLLINKLIERINAEPCWRSLPEEKLYILSSILLQNFPLLYTSLSAVNKNKRMCMTLAWSANKSNLPQGKLVCSVVSRQLFPRSIICLYFEKVSRVFSTPPFEVWRGLYEKLVAIAKEQPVFCLLYHRRGFWNEEVPFFKTCV